ncbi:MAG TPA: hypothetical protein VFW86_06385, partial [Candidatus Limnocylindrales bacterium]|nr:hypothetical protein [Candidatus Limnocylindrales bacterium]
IETNFGSTRVCIPAGAAVRITPSGAFSSNDLQNSGLERAGDAWQTDDYASAATRLDLAIQSNFGSLHLQRGGC